MGKNPTRHHFLTYFICADHQIESHPKHPRSDESLDLVVASHPRGVSNSPKNMFNTFLIYCFPF